MNRGDSLSALTPYNHYDILTLQEDVPHFSYSYVVWGRGVLFLLPQIMNFHRFPLLSAVNSSHAFVAMPGESTDGHRKKPVVPTIKGRKNRLLVYRIYHLLNWLVKLRMKAA